MRFPCPDCRVPLTVEELDGPREAPLCPHCAARVVVPGGKGARPRAVDSVATLILMGPIGISAAWVVTESVAVSRNIAVDVRHIPGPIVVAFLIAAAISGGIRYNSRVAWWLARRYARIGWFGSLIGFLSSVPCLIVGPLPLLLFGLFFAYFVLLNRLMNQPKVLQWRGIQARPESAPKWWLRRLWG